MGDILSKLQMVSEKIGVTETAHTIEEQVDLISESLDKIPHSTNIAEALDDLSEVAQNINNEEVYIDKTITENGEYLPAYDEATAYSKVTVNVPANFNCVKCYLPLYDNNGDIVNARTIEVLNAQNGEYTVHCNAAPDPYYYYGSILLSPAKKITVDPGGPSVKVLFTPSNEFTTDNIIWGSTSTTFTVSGDTITPGDGKAYHIKISYDGTIVVKKFEDYNFNFSIT